MAISINGKNGALCLDKGLMDLNMSLFLKY